MELGRLSMPDDADGISLRTTSGGRSYWGISTVMSRV